MQKNLEFREVVTIISEDEEDKQFKGLTGIIIGIAKNDDDFISNYLVQIFDSEGSNIESSIFYPKDLVSTGKMAHGEFNKSHFSLKVSNDGNITDVIEPLDSFFILMESLTIFKYVDGDSKMIPVKLKKEVLANNKSYEILNKKLFSKWDSGEKITPSKQVEIMKNFKEVMLAKFGVEIDYE